MKIFSPAKVNLHLRILGKRADGYHDIQSLMHRIDLGDELEIEPGERGIEVITSGAGEEIPQERNLVWRAARSWTQAAGKEVSVRFRLQKRIPMAAGLGGGSSNAAAALTGLNEMYGARFTREELIGLGARIGADIPFFIFERAAWAGGIGEKLTPVTFDFPLSLLLAVPPFPISTAWAYEAYDRLELPARKPAEISSRYGSLDDLRPLLENDLEEVALRRYPEMAAMKETLLARGARGALMSGSGSSMFGLFGSREEAEEARRRISWPAGWKTYVARGI